MLLLYMLILCFLRVFFHAWLHCKSFTENVRTGEAMPDPVYTIQSVVKLVVSYKLRFSYQFVFISNTLQCV